MKVEEVKFSEQLGDNVLLELSLDNGGSAWTWITKGEEAEHVLLQLKSLVSKLEFWINRDKHSE